MNNQPYSYSAVHPTNNEHQTELVYSLEDEQDESTSSHTVPSTSNNQTRQNNHEGLFQNLAAKPQGIKQFEEIEPPSYVDATNPHTTDIILQQPIDIFQIEEETGEIIIEGMYLGNFYILFVNLIISVVFDLVGFLITTIMANTHAARAGSRMGFGLTLIRYGMYLKSKEALRDMLASEHYNDNLESPEVQKIQREWMTYVMFGIGFLLILHSNFEYFRIARLRHLIITRSLGVSSV